MTDAWLRDEVDVDEFFEPGFTFAGRRSSAPTVDGGIEAIRDMLGYWTDAGAAQAHTECIAVRGDDLSLQRQTIVTSAGDEFETIAIGQLGQSGRWTNFTVYDPEQLDEAYDELERRWLESGGPADIIQIVQASCRSIRESDPALLRSMLDDTFVDIDHRPSGMGSRTVDDYVASVAMLSEHGARIYAPQIAEYTDGVHLIQFVLEYSGGCSEAWVVATRRDGRLTRTEDYAADDYLAAKARYDELRAS